MATLDLATRKFWRAAGRAVDLDGAEAWLAAPLGTRHGGDAWLSSEAARLGGTLVEGDPDAGLQPDLSGLAGPGFDPTAVHPLIHDFYTHTSRWRMEVWSGWSPLFWPAGELISRLFGRRVRQLALPTRPLDVARGMDSQVSVIRDNSGAQAAAAWIRTLRSNGDVVFAGQYSRRVLPGAMRPSIHAAFPLEDGNVQVFLQPQHRPGGGLRLASHRGPWGSDGAYVVVRDRGRTYGCRVPLHETFDLYLDDEQVLRTDHTLRLGPAAVVRLHYKLERLTSG